MCSMHQTLHVLIKIHCPTDSRKAISWCIFHKYYKRENESWICASWIHSCSDTLTCTIMCTKDLYKGQTAAVWLQLLDLINFTASETISICLPRGLALIKDVHRRAEHWRLPSLWRLHNGYTLTCGSQTLRKWVFFFWWRIVVIMWTS